MTPHVPLDRVLTAVRSVHRQKETAVSTPETGTDLIAAERQRQINKEGWTPEHDAEHPEDDLALAAACYALPPHSGGRGYGESRPPFAWPWDEHYWKPCPDDRVRELVKAGALIAAEIDRLQAQR